MSLFLCGLVYLAMGCCGGAYTEKSMILQDLEDSRQAEMEAVNRKWETQRSAVSDI